jgi:hypothetical protein
MSCPYIFTGTNEIPLSLQTTLEPACLSIGISPASSLRSHSHPNTFHSTQSRYSDPAAYSGTDACHPHFHATTDNNFQPHRHAALHG